MIQESFPVYLIDEITTKPGQARKLFEAYMARYVPGATARGMQLKHSLVEPAFWLEHGTNRLIFIWSLAGPSAVWSKNFSSRQEPEVHAFWSEVDALASSRKRSTLCEGNDIGTAIDV